MEKEVIICDLNKKTEKLMCVLDDKIEKLAHRLQYDFINYLRLVYPGSTIQILSGMNSEEGAVYQMIGQDHFLQQTNRQRKCEETLLFSFQSAEWIGEKEFRLVFKTSVGELLNSKTTFQLLKTGPDTTTLVLKTRFNKDRSVGSPTSKRDHSVLMKIVSGARNIFFPYRRSQDTEQREKKLILGIYSFF